MEACWKPRLSPQLARLTPRSTDSNFTLRSLLALTHRHSHCQPSLLSTASADFQKKAEYGRFWKRKKNKIKKSMRKLAGPAHWAALLPVFMRFLSIFCADLSPFSKDRQFLGCVCLVTCNWSQRPKQASASWRENRGRLLSFLSSFSYLFKFLFNSTKGSSLCLLLFFLTWIFKFTFFFLTFIFLVYFASSELLSEIHRSEIKTRWKEAFFFSWEILSSKWLLCDTQWPLPCEVSDKAKQVAKPTLVGGHVWQSVSLYFLIFFFYINNKP